MSPDIQEVEVRPEGAAPAAQEDRMGTPGRKPRTYMQATETATGDLDGEPFLLRTGEVFASDHPIVRAFPHFFEPLEAKRQRPPVEQMTQAPGEKRG